MAAGQAVSAVGTLLQASSTSTRTISINPTVVRNLVYMGVIVESATGTTAPSAITGGNCVGLAGSGGWSLLAATVGPASTGVNFQLSLWAGVATATGSATCTVTTTAAGGVWVDMLAQQFTCSGINALTQWALDGAAATRSNSTASTTCTYPTLTPNNTNSAYLGFGFPAGSASATGQTSGYTIELDSANNPLLFRATGIGSGSAQTPTNVNTTSIKSTTLAAMLTATNPLGGQFLPFFGGPSHHEDELEQRPSGLYVQRRRIAGIRPDGGRDRVLVRAGS